MNKQLSSAGGKTRDAVWIEKSIEIQDEAVARFENNKNYYVCVY